MTRVYYTSYKDAKKQSQAGRDLLDFVLREYYHIGAYELKRTELGKPYIEGEPVHFNLSHSGGVAVLAVSDGPVGVDVEPMRDIRPEVIKRYMGIELSEPEERLWAWLRRESYGKMTGEGFFVKEPYAVCHYRPYVISAADEEYYVCVCSPTDEFAPRPTPCSVPEP